MKPLSFFHTLLTSVSKHSSTITSISPNQPVIPAQQPSVDNLKAWPAYWKEQGQPWRTEPKIDTERLHELSKCCAIPPDIKKGIYPFKGMKLSRADVEWLLSSHEFEREGLDVRGADISHGNLQGLPLTRLRGGLTFTEYYFGTEQERSNAAVHMEKANLTGAHLEGAIFGGAQLQGADFHDTQLSGADFTGAQLQSVNFTSANLWRAMLSMAQLDKSIFGGAQLREANLSWAKLNEARFIGAQLSRADLSQAQLEKANFNSANLEGTILSRSHLGRSDLRNALLKETLLSDAILADKQGIGPCLADGTVEQRKPCSCQLDAGDQAWR